MGVKSFLFGKKPKPESTSSGNYAWDVLKGPLTPALGYVTGGGNMLGNLLGVNGGPAQTSALNNYANSGGMQFLMEQGQKAITSSKAASGLLNSGSYGTALEKYGQGLASTYLNDYMKNLLGYSQLGIGAAGALAGAGSHSQGTGATQGKSGAFPYVLQAASMIPGISDARVKKNIKKIGEYKSGLPKYSFEFKKGHGPEGRFEGPMAHEVKKLLPSAYLPGFYGQFDGVDYAQLGN